MHGESSAAPTAATTSLPVEASTMRANAVARSETNVPRAEEVRCGNRAVREVLLHLLRTAPAGGYAQRQPGHR